MVLPMKFSVEPLKFYFSKPSKPLPLSPLRPGSSIQEKGRFFIDQSRWFPHYGRDVRQSQSSNHLYIST